MSTFEKQLVIHSLPFPKEIIIIINDFIFKDITSSSREKKNVIINLINTTTFSGKYNNSYLEEQRLIFWIEQDDNSKQFQITFCNICGNYIPFFLNDGTSDKVLCNC